MEFSNSFVGTGCSFWGECRQFVRNSGWACKPDFVPHAALTSACAAIIPLGHGSRHGSSSLPEGCSLRRLAPMQRERVHRNRRREAAKLRER